MDLYHADIRLPEGFRLPARIVKLAWTAHAERARLDDRYGEIPRFNAIDLSTKSVIEVGLTGKRVEKVVVRGSLDENRDIIYVLIPNGLNAWTVKTVWVNLNTDTHKTLDRSKYMR